MNRGGIVHQELGDCRVGLGFRLQRARWVRVTDHMDAEQDSRARRGTRVETFAPKSSLPYRRLQETA
eukprot:4232391-Amphidinium_carterae.1